MGFLKLKNLGIQVNTRLGSFNLTLPRTITAKDVFDRVTRCIGLREFWYFGLSGTDKSGACIWLDLQKKLVDQNLRKSDSSYCVHLTVKYFPENINKIILNVTKRLVYLHMRDSIRRENLFCPPEVALVLASYCAQEQYGDYDPSIHCPGLILNSDFLPPSIFQQYQLSNMDLESIVFQMYTKRAGMPRETAIVTYLSICQDLDMYGLRHLPVTTTRGTTCLVAIDSFGLKFFSSDDILVPKTAFTLAELRRVHFTRNRVEFDIGMDTTQKLVIFTTDANMAKRLLLRCLGYRDLYIRGMSEDPNLLGYIVEGTARSIVHGISMESRNGDDIMREIENTQTIVNDRLAKYDTEWKEAVDQLQHIERERAFLQQKVAALEAVQSETVRKQNLTIRAKNFYDFHTGLSGATIPTVARDHTKMKAETVRLRNQATRGHVVLENHRVALKKAQNTEAQLKRSIEADFVTLEDLHVFDNGISENDACITKEVDLAFISSDERRRPWHGLYSFSKTDAVTHHEITRITCELSKHQVTSRQTVVDVLHQKNCELHEDKFTALHAILAQTTRERIRVLEKM